MPFLRLLGTAKRVLQPFQISNLSLICLTPCGMLDIESSPQRRTNMISESVKSRAKKLVARMTVEEKCSQLRYDSPAIERLGVPAYNWWNEGLHGLARAGALPGQGQTGRSLALTTVQVFLLPTCWNSGGSRCFPTKTASVSDSGQVRGALTPNACKALAS